MCKSDFGSLSNPAVAHAKSLSVELIGSGAGRDHHLPRRLDDDYVLSREVLGTGGFASVSAAVSRHTGGRFAVKRMMLKGLSPGHRSRVETEASILMDLDHPHVVRVADVYHCEEHIDLVMECMEGGELFDRLAKWGSFPECSAASTVRQILLALRYVHGCNLAHRDLKLENVLFDRKGSDHLKLVDFGLAKVVEVGVPMSPKVGTPGYCAPEVAKRSYSTQCDMWSLGVIAHALLVGQMPVFPAGTGSGFVVSPHPWRDISPSALDLVKRLLVPDPLIRLTTHEALQHPWLSGNQGTGLPRVNGRMFADLQAFARAPPLRRACMSAMVWSLDSAEQAAVRDTFTAFDVNNKGIIELSELQDVLLLSTSGAKRDQVASLLSGLNAAGGGAITYSEFLAAMCGSRIRVKDGHVRDVFRRFDMDGCGHITKGDMDEVLGDSPGKLLAEADRSGDGTVSLDELSAYLRPRRWSLCFPKRTVVERKTVCGLAGTRRDMNEVFGESPDKSLAQANRSGDGVVSFDELDASLRPRRWRLCFPRRTLSEK